MIKPILLNTEMVKTILVGKKTCIRRKIPIDIVDFCNIDHDGTLLSYQNSYGDFINPEKLCRYQPGDILYVRETWHKYTKRIGEGAACHLAEFYGYKASIANSKEAARIWLKVTDVRVERLQDITDKDAEREGAQPDNPFDYDVDKWPNLEYFKEIWNSTIKKSDLDTYGWDANPYVWVIDFERCKRPE